MSLVLAADFLLEKRFSFFSEYFPSGDIQLRLDDTEKHYFPEATIELWGDSRAEGLKLLTAHSLQVDMMNAAMLASMAANLQAGGQASIQPTYSSTENGYDLTPFGRQYNQLLRSIAVTGFYF